jgi:hypothetical protein
MKNILNIFIILFFGDLHSFVPTLGDGQQGFWYIKEHLINENNLFTIQNISNNLFFQGTLIEKLDLATGQLQWQHYRYTEDIGYREATRNTSIINNRIVVPIYKEKVQNASSNLTSTYFGKRTLDPVSGIVLDSVQSDQLDPNNRPLLAPFNAFIPIIQTYQIPISDSTTSFIRQIPTTTQTSFIQLTLNDKGYVLDSNSIIIPVPFQSNDISVRSIDHNRNLIFTSGYQASTTGEDPKLYCYIGVTTVDNKTLLEPKEISNAIHNFTAGYRLEWVGPEYFLVRVQESKSSVPSENDLYFIQLDYEGHVINKYKVSGEIHSINTTLFKATMIDRNQIAVCGLQLLNDKHRINFYTNDLNNNVQLKSFIGTESINQNISVLEFSITPDKQVLLNLIQKNNTLPLQIKPNWSLWVLFSGVDLGIISKTSEQVNTSKVNISPNPAISQIEVTSDVQFDQINIYNSQGESIKDVVNSRIVDLSEFTNGVYILEVLRNKIICGRQKFIKFE